MHEYDALIARLREARDRGVFDSKTAFEDFVREERRLFIGDDANSMTEQDYVCELAEDGWPDYEKWLDIWCRLNGGGELTPREREQAVAYYGTEDGDDVPEQYLLAEESP